jgi:tRNA(Ile)-lysidine synthase
MDLVTAFKENIKKQGIFQPKDTLLLAVSGGVDSVVLCALCKQAGYHFAIAHCNFKLRGEDSIRDEKFVAKLAQQYDVPFHHISFDTTTIAQQQKKSIETAARALRYTWFETIRKEIGYQYIVTAHHGDDNIETVLMNFLRGTGIRGLHGILPVQQHIARPLLFTNKKELIAYASEKRLDYVADHTNEENEFTRNYFRNVLIPSVQNVFPNVEENVTRNINRMAEVEELYNQAIEHHKKRLIERRGNEIHIPVMKLLKTAPLSTVVYEIIKEYGFTAHQTEEVIALLQSDSGKYVTSSSYRVLKNRNWLIISLIDNTIAQNILIDKSDNKIVFGMGELELIATNKFDIKSLLSVAKVDLSTIKFPLMLRKWKQGDYFYPLGMKKKKKVSRFLIDQKLSLTQKEKVWVIEMNKKIVWVVGMRIDDRFKITPDTKEILQITLTVAE